MAEATVSYSGLYWYVRLFYSLHLVSNSPNNTDIIICTFSSHINTATSGEHFSLAHYEWIYSVIVIPGSTELITLNQMLSYIPLPWVLYEPFHGFCLLCTSISMYEGIVDTSVLMYSFHTSLKAFTSLPESTKEDAMMESDRRLASYINEYLDSLSYVSSSSGHLLNISRCCTQVLVTLDYCLLDGKETLFMFNLDARQPAHPARASFGEALKGY